MRNLLLVHLESLNSIIYDSNRELFPALRHWERKSISFSKYFSTATSTLMMLSDMAYGGMLHNEPCCTLRSPLQKYCYTSSLLDELEKEGYRVGVLGYPATEEGDTPSCNARHFIGYGAELEEFAHYRDYLGAMDSMMAGEGPFVIWACNYISNVSCNCLMEDVGQQTGIERWESGYRCMDSCVQELLGCLEKRRLLDSTTVIFYGDHGDDFISHGKHGGLMHAIEPYAALIHTPFWVYDSRFAPTQTDMLIDTTDVRGMLRGLLDLPEGRWNLEDMQLPQRKYSLARNTYAAQKVRETSFHKAYSLTDGKFLFLAGDQGMELYHMGMDAGCQSNLLDYFDFDGERLVLNEIAYGEVKYHFRSLIDAAAIEQIKHIFYEYREQLIREVERLYQYAECTTLSLEIDFSNINYGWDERAWRAQAASSLGAAQTGKYEEFDVYGRYLEGKRVLLYGAGSYGKYFYEKLASNVEITAWTDRNYKEAGRIFGREIQSPDCITELSFDVLFIAIANDKVRQEVREHCVRLGIPREKIF